MPRLGRGLRVAALLALAAVCLRAPGDRVREGAAGMAFSSAMPGTVVWAWEEPEDLRTAQAGGVGVAFLAETLELDGSGKDTASVRVRSRHQPLAVAPGAATMAVVRVIAGAGFEDSEPLRHETAVALAEVAARPGVRALQIDFDATRSQREFYAAVLRELRAKMPQGMPLSITALVSWCARPSWLAGLPIDEAVPMFFRLGGTARPLDSKLGYTVREPLCQGSVGVSTDESWPEIRAGQRVYLFAPRPWTAGQLEAVEGAREGHRAAALEPKSNENLRVGNDTGLRASGDRDEERER